MRKSKENLLVLKLKHPLIEESLVKYIEFPSEYLLKKRLELSDEEVLIHSSSLRVFSGYGTGSFAGTGGQDESGPYFEKCRER